MNRSRYMTVNEKSPYLVKRRVKGPRNDGANEPAITLLPLNSYTVIGGPDIPWTSSPRFYRAVAPKSAKNREASSFVILGEQSRSPVLSRPGSPSGRISPFRGHGFKTPTTTRPNSRANSPQHATSKKTAKITEGPRKSALENREKFNLYVGLPPKSPIGRSKFNLTQNYHNDFEEYNVTAEKLVQSNGYENVDNDAANCLSECVKTGTDDVTVSVQEVVSAEKEKPCETEGGETFEQEARSQEEEHHQNEGNREEQQEEDVNKEDSQGKGECCSGSAGLRRKSIHKSFETLGPDWELSNAMDKLQPVDYYKTDRHESLRKSTPSSPAVRKKSKTESNLQNRERTVKAAKPPMPPKKIGMKTTLKSNEGSDMKGKAGRGILKDRSGVKVSKKMDGPAGTRGNQKQAEKIGGTDKEAKSVGANPTDKILNDTKKLTEVLQTIEGIGPDKDKEKKEEDTTKMVPCYQPDKCNLAPPTMASPSPIITPSFSTPSTSADLAFNTTKNSQSISAAPTSVTSCSLSSVSSTVVLTGNLARKENPKEPKLVAEAKNAEKKPEPPPNGVEANGTVTGPDSTGKDTLEMVKAGSRDRGKDKMSTEIASKTDVIKAQPDMEVLSPNNLRNSPPRMPPANVAWDENRMPNGDVPARAPQQSKFRRFISALCRFFGCLFCCRCCCTSCRGGNANEPANSSRSTCCSNPFKCLTCKCNKPKCCEGSRCCKRKSKPLGDNRSKQKRGKCCAKPICSCTVFREKINRFCRCLFCLNLMCCQNLLKKCKCCHKLKCCQSNGCCSCCNPFAKPDPKKLIKKGSRASSNSKGKDQLDVVLVEHTSRMKAAIPVLPSCLAVFCLICNIFIPGFGTIISGLLCLCFGKPRFSTNDTPINRFKSFVINTIIGIAQAFTIVFCLVGWGWSIWWGVIMYKLSRRQKRLKLAEKNQREAGSSNVNQNHGDVEQG